MLTLRERRGRDHLADATITLTFDQRRRSRLRARLDDGREVALMLPRATVLRHGDVLVGDVVARVIAAAEEVSTARTADPRLLARACYHLGNRHIPVEVGEGYARYQHDHVLDHMVAELGLAVTVDSVAFEPEAGAYGDGSGDGHGHGHGHGHGGGHGSGHGHGGGDGHGHGHGHGHPSTRPTDLAPLGTSGGSGHTGREHEHHRHHDDEGDDA